MHLHSSSSSPSSSLDDDSAASSSPPSAGRTSKPTRSQPASGASGAGSDDRVHVARY